jgi:hypothetical protein
MGELHQGDGCCLESSRESPTRRGVRVGLQRELPMFRVLLGVLVNRPIDLRLASSALSRSMTPLCSFKEPTLVRPPHPATIPPEDVQKDCAVTHTKGSGPGGQHRNKVQTAVVLKHQPTGLSAMWKTRPIQPGQSDPSGSG